MARTIGFLGPVGTYTEEAALLYDSAADLRPFPSIPDVGEAVRSAQTDQGVVPIENSLEGSVTFTLDLLIRQPDLYINSEIVLPIEHYLMGKSGTRLADVQVIYSHPQALAQCREYLVRTFPQAVQLASLSTVAAVGEAMASDVAAAAIAPRRGAELNDAEILAQNISDVPNNVTRFAVLAKADHAPTGRDKTSICFSFGQDVPGQLYQVIGEFAKRNVNLAKIESRPTKQLLGEYIFLIDCDGHREDPSVREAIEAISRPATTLKVLGSYPRWEPRP